jgi:MoxR-like ATPase
MPFFSFEEKKENIVGSITDEEYAEWSKEIGKIKIPENVHNVIDVVRDKIQKYNEDNKENVEKQIYVSDRRWRKIVRLMRASAFINDRTEVDLMDCFLIKHCIWNEKEQIDTVWQFVREAIEERGYTKEIDFEGIKDELTEFSKEVDTYTHETRSIKYTKNKIYDLNGNKYLKILGLNGKFNYEDNNLIEEKMVNVAKKDSFISTMRYRKDFGDKDNVQIKQGKTKHSLILSNDQYSTPYELNIETIDATKNEVFTKEPHPKVKEDWDNRVNGFLQHTGGMKNQIEQYRNKDLAHLRTNLFVEPELANIVESHITKTLKEIEKIELEIREIQNNYKKFKDEEVVLND